MQERALRVLVVDDDDEFSTALGLILERDGYAVVHGRNGEEALALAGRDQPDLIILDLVLPGLSGLEVCCALRKWFTDPILVVSGRGDEETVVQALDCGADDYLIKPFRSAELSARLRALNRRRRTSESKEDSLEVGHVRIDFPHRRVQVEGAEVQLTRTEFEIIALLARNLGRVVTAETILRRIWGPLRGDYTQTLRVHVGHIRQKIERDPSSPCYLLTEHGVGYRFQRPAAIDGPTVQKGATSRGQAARAGS